MGQLTLDSTAVSQSSRGTFFTMGWWHVEPQPTAGAYFWVHTWHCTCIFASCPPVYRWTFRGFITFVLEMLCFILLSVSVNKLREVWGSKLPKGILTKDYHPVQGVSLWLINLCLTCFTFEDPSELSTANTCWCLPFCQIYFQSIE